jgi:hypothetical protein
MAAIAINVLWFLIGLIILCGVIWIVIWVIEQFVMPIPEQIKKGVWVIVLLLALIFLIGALTGHIPFQLGKAELPSGVFAAISTRAAADL